MCVHASVYEYACMCVCESGADLGFSEGGG